MASATEVILLGPQRHPKFSRPVYGDRESLRFATPEIVAGYRAIRLSTRVAVDLCCGIGGQAIALSGTCERVLAVDIEPQKVEWARLNAEIYGARNSVFRTGDALSDEVREWVRGQEADLVFCDPSRPPTEEARRLDSLSPRIEEIIESYDWISDFAFEAPPQLRPENIPLDCEKEYLSLEGELNRLTLYFGRLKEAERSAAVLPGGHRLLSRDITPPGESVRPLAYVYEPEPSVIRAGVLGELVSKLDVSMEMVILSGEPFLTAEELVDSPFIKNKFIPRGQTALDHAEINAFLRARRAGSAVPRWNMSPEQYWATRKRIERGLGGQRIYHVFEYGGLALLCEKI